MLTSKQKLYCQEYVVDCNGTQAAIRAGYAKNSAMVSASRLMSNPSIRDRIEKLMLAKDKKTTLTALQVLQAVSEIAMNQSASLMTRLKALELLGRHHNLWTESTPLEAQDRGATRATVNIYLPQKARLPHETVVKVLD